MADLKRTVFPIRLRVDTFDLINSGIVLSVGCGLLSIVSSIWIGLILLDSRKRTNTSTTRVPLSTRLLKFEWMSLAFMDIWILATVIPVTYIARTGSAYVRAFLSGNELPASVVAATQARLGVKSDYWHNYSGTFLPRPAETSCRVTCGPAPIVQFISCFVMHVLTIHI